MRDYLVDVNLYRARVAGLPFTLTQKQWQSTLKHFNHRCAYCGGLYDALEHFLPVSRGGGTTYGNCIPTCASCNVCKDHPKFILFNDREKAMKTLERILAYLKGVAPEEIDQQRIDEYMEHQRTRVPIHHNSRGSKVV